LQVGYELRHGCAGVDDVLHQEDVPPFERTGRCRPSRS
jgi:hypothetical protein